MSNPVEMHPADLYGISSSGSINIGGTNGVIDPGTILPGPDGKRYFYGTAGVDCIFIQVSVNKGVNNKLGNFYYQKISSFKSDVTIGAVAGEVARRTTATKEVIKDFMDIFIGVLACTTGPLAISITGMNLLVAGGTLYKNYGMYKEGMAAFVDEKENIRTKTPVFFRIVLEQLIFADMENFLQGKAAKLITSNLPGNKIGGKIAGVFIGKIGEDRTKARLKTINTLITDVLLKVTKHVIEKHETLDSGQIEQLAKFHVLKILKTLAAPTQQEAEQIIRETANNASLVQEPLKRLSKALKAFGTDKYGDY